MRTLKLIITAICIASVSFFLLTGCPTAPVVTPTIVGTWVNSDYNGLEGPYAKMEYIDTGAGTYTIKMFINDTDTLPDITGTGTKTEEWTDSEGNLFLKIEMDIGTTLYALMKIHANNQKLEGVSSDSDYPTEVDPLHPTYAIYDRQ
jgi:hypothetical protein